jgi:mannose-6-phosphate isomerase-like protein (cupin superfamily)
MRARLQDASESESATHHDGATMKDFPAFMKCAVNRIATSSQATRGVEGYVFEGADGSQMAFWTCRETAVSTPHVHEFDEYMVVVEGCYTLIIDGTRIPVETGEEYFIPAGISHAGEVVTGTRTIHAFGGHRADRTGLTRPIGPN